MRLSVFNDASADEISCDGGLQATFTLPDYDISVTSSLVKPLEEGWTEQVGRFPPNIPVDAVVEVYCYREGQPPGYVKASGVKYTGGAPTPLIVYPPPASYPTEQCAGSDTWLESTEPVPCVGFLEPKN